MRRWDYRIETRTADQIDEDLDQFETYLDTMGERGWELATLIPPRETRYPGGGEIRRSAVLIFKRQRESLEV